MKLNESWLLRQRREHPRGWTWMVTMILAGLSLLVGLGVVLYDGVGNRVFRHMVFWIAVGMVAFYVPGLLMGAAALGLRRGRRGLVRAGAIAAAAQGMMALLAVAGQLTLFAFDLPIFYGGLLWAAGAFYVSWRLWRALPWVKADAEATPGFEVEAVEAETVG